jgi:hypothetical protein
MIVRLADVSREKEGVDVSHARVSDTAKPGGEYSSIWNKLVFSNGNSVYGWN